MVQTVPEPTTTALLRLGVGGVGAGELAGAAASLDERPKNLSERARGTRNPTNERALVRGVSCLRRRVATLLDRAYRRTKLAQVARLHDCQPRHNGRIRVRGGSPARRLIRLVQRRPELGQVDHSDGRASR